VTEEERGSSEKHDGNRVCPFMSAGYFQPCIKEDCMAWKDGECLLIQEKKS